MCIVFILHTQNQHLIMLALYHIVAGVVVWSTSSLRLARKKSMFMRLVVKLWPFTLLNTLGGLLVMQARQPLMEPAEIWPVTLYSTSGGGGMWEAWGGHWLQMCQAQGNTGGDQKSRSLDIYSSHWELLPATGNHCTSLSVTGHL